MHVAVFLCLFDRGGTKVEVWVPAEAYTPCNRTGPSGPMYNSMILPYAEGPMAMSGIIWCKEERSLSLCSVLMRPTPAPHLLILWKPAQRSPSDAQSHSLTLQCALLALRLVYHLLWFVSGVVRGTLSCVADQGEA